MKRLDRIILGIALALAVLWLYGADPVLAVSPQEGDAKNKYAELEGDYEFDLNSMGMGIVVMNVYVEGDSLWIWPETSSEPAEMVPSEDAKFKFTIEDDEEGLYVITFLTDEGGKYTKCRVVNEDMGIDATGTKLEK